MICKTVLEEVKQKIKMAKSDDKTSQGILS